MRRRTLTLGLAVLATGAAFAAPRLAPALRPMATQPGEPLDRVVRPVDPPNAAGPVAPELVPLVRPDVLPPNLVTPNLVTPNLVPPPIPAPPPARPERPRVSLDTIPEVRHPVPVTDTPIQPRPREPVNRPPTTIPELDAAPLKVVVPPDPPRAEWDDCPNCGMG